MNYENGNGFRKFRSCFHYSKAERYNLSTEKKVDDFSIIILRSNVVKSRGSEREKNLSEGEKRERKGKRARG